MYIILYFIYSSYNPLYLEEANNNNIEWINSNLFLKLSHVFFSHKIQI